MPSRNTATVIAACSLAGVIYLGALVIGTSQSARARRLERGQTSAATHLVTGKEITPFADTHTGVGNYPMRAVLSPDGQFALVSDMGARAYLSVLDVHTGALVSRLKFLTKGEGLYYGIAFGPTAEDGTTPVYVSRGSMDVVSILTLTREGKLNDTGQGIKYPTLPPDSLARNPAGIVISPDGKTLYAADNTALPGKAMQGTLHIFDTATKVEKASLLVPGYPYGIALAGNKLYLTSEQQGCVAVVDVSDASAPKLLRTIQTGADPVSLILSKNQKQLFVANASSDTVTVLNTSDDTIERTLLLRPVAARGLPGATPLGTALSPNESHLFVTLADMNAVAVVRLATGQVEGYIPTGWYPSDVVVAPDGKNLLVSCARGVQTRNPNGKPVAVAQTDTPKRAQYITNILEGTVSRIDLDTALKSLPDLTEQVMANNALTARKDLLQTARTALKNPGIRHVIYIVKENRTYDQVLGDIATGDGDKSLCLFGRDVTPNLHALAERFVLLDNFYCCAEVSGDGWNWSTTGMASHYVSRNVPYSYAQTRPYDFEGQNNNVTVDRVGMPDVARSPGGYIWDACEKAGVSFRNYGFFVTSDGAAPRTPESAGVDLDEAETGTKNALAPNTDPNFREFDMRYPDSDAIYRHGLKLPAKAAGAYGADKAPSRMAAFLKEYDGYVKGNNLPQFMMVRLPHDHTSVTTEGLWSPRAMIADNDYAVGEMVEAISHSPYWKDTAIFVVEDDAQNGYDHVDAHRSTAYVISPYVKKSLHDNRFYNTDSVLHTMECLLGMDPMTQYDAIAPTLNIFTKKPDNDAPYTAILPAKEIIGEINTKKAYRAADSAHLLNPLREESRPDEELNAILWRNAKGPSAPLPAKHYAGVHAYAASVPDSDDD